MFVVGFLLQLTGTFYAGGVVQEGEKDMTPEQFERLLSVLGSLSRSLGGSYWQEWQLVLFGTLVGGFFAVLGAVVEALVEDWRSSKREARRKKEEAEEEAKRKREEWIQKALNWAATGRKESLRRADLKGADLRGVDLGCGYEITVGSGTVQWSGEYRGADLSYADLNRADLLQANLQRANLEGTNLQEADLRLANLQEAKLWYADLQEAKLGHANLQGAFLWYANLQGADLGHANLQGAKYNNATIWPEGFIPPPEAVNVDPQTNVED